MHITITPTRTLRQTDSHQTVLHIPFVEFQRRTIVAAASRDTAPQNGNTPTPAINLSGKWLREAGFDTGTGVTVRIANGCIVLVPDSDEVQALRQQLQQTQRAVKRMAGEIVMG